MSLTSLHQSFWGCEPAKVEPIAGSGGSSRRYYRFTGGDNTTVIGCEGDDVDENRAFIYLSRHFLAKGLPVARIIAVADDESCYLLEDLGDTSLFNAISAGIASGTFSDDEIELLRKSIKRLADIQYAGAEGLDFTKCYPQEAMDGRMVMWDLNYFKYCFLKLHPIEFNEALLQDDFDRLCTDIMSVEADTFMYRDFQSRNVMMRNGEPYFIDYQGGRRGPAHYDVASFLWQAKARLSPALRDKLVDAYLDAASRYRDIDREEFRRELKLFVLFRTLQVLGAYGYRGLIQKKAHFVESIPYAIANLRSLLDDGGDIKASYPYLYGLLHSIVSSRQFAPIVASNKLIVKVMSFSYKKGIPEDYSGNGGGFVFDCRAIHNPGRYEPYKQLTGRDAPVIEFLEEDGGVTRFLENVYALVDTSVETYLRRGFTSLMVSFGCTGGRHRSVYCAEQTARHLHEKYNVEVHLIHRERQIEETLK